MKLLLLEAVNEHLNKSKIPREQLSAIKKSKEIESGRSYYLSTFREDSSRKNEGDV